MTRAPDRWRFGLKVKSSPRRRVFGWVLDGLKGRSSTASAYSSAGEKSLLRKGL